MRPFPLASTEWNDGVSCQWTYYNCRFYIIERKERRDIFSNICFGDKLADNFASSAVKMYRRTDNFNLMLLHSLSKQCKETVISGNLASFFSRFLDCEHPYNNTEVRFGKIPSTFWFRLLYGTKSISKMLRELMPPIRLAGNDSQKRDLIQRLEIISFLKLTKFDLSNGVIAWNYSVPNSFSKVIGFIRSL